jgi:hypothetical protein
VIAVGRALCRWREQHPALAGLRLQARLVTDPDSTTAEQNRSTLTLRFEASECRAVVPFTLTEELKASKTENLQALAEAVGDALNGRAYLLDPDAAIHRLTLRSASSDRDPGLAGTATLEWEGLASW